MQNISEAARPVPLAKSYALFNHGPVTLVSSAHNGQRNVMAAAWAMPLDFDPPKVALVVDRRTHTRTLIEASGKFALNIPTRAIAAKVLAVGSCSGSDSDKFATLDIEAFRGQDGELPLIRGCAAWLECRILPEEHNQQQYDLFIGEVFAAWADPAIYSEGRWHFNDDSQRTLHYVGGGSFFLTGPTIDVSSRSP